MNMFTGYLLWSLQTHVWFDLILAPWRAHTNAVTHHAK